MPIGKGSRNKRADNWRQNRYTEEEKRYAVSILKEYGDSLHVTDEGYMAVRAQMGNVGRSSLVLWLREYGRTTHPLSTVIAKRERLEYVQSEVSKAAQQGGGVVGSGESLLGEAYAIGLSILADPNTWKRSSDLRNITLAWGIIEERSRIRVGMSKEYMDVCKRFAQLAAEKGFDHVLAMEQLIQSYSEEDDSNVIDAQR